MSRQDMTRNLSGWKGLDVDAANKSRLSQAEAINTQRQDLAKAYDMTFTSGSGPEVLQDLIRLTYGEPQYNFNSPNCNEQAAYIAGRRDIVDLIHAHLNLAQRGPTHE